MSLKTTNNTGFGNNGNDQAGRFFNENGHPNVKKVGIPFWEQYSLYHWLISMASWKFVLLVLTSFVVINLFFACLYQLIGLQHLSGLMGETATDQFREAFFFSCQTFTTVGYGRINPVGFFASLLAAFEALSGYMSFALITGLLYGRFSLPKANIVFSDLAIITPYKDGYAFMCRFSNGKRTVLTEATAKISMAIKERENGVFKNNFYNLPLEIDSVNALYLSWTLVHPINEESPLWGMTFEQMLQLDMEFLVFFKAYDEKFSNSVLARKSYIASELMYDVKFKPMFYPSENKKVTVLDFSKINAVE
jgi:inward rectifier potassium channel